MAARIVHTVRKNRDSMLRAFFNWSGGKDSALALYHVRRAKEFDVQRLLTTVNEEFQRISMHGVREELLERQAESLGIPLVKCRLPAAASMQIYDTRMMEVIAGFEADGIETAIFGDIFLEDLRAYREEKLAQSGIRAAFPLWQRNTRELIHEFVDLGFKAIIVCVNERRLDKSFAGRLIDREFINDFPDTADICGENGEYHSFVFDGPIFRQTIAFEVGETVYRNDTAPQAKDEKDCPSSAQPGWDTAFWFTDLLPISTVPVKDKGRREIQR
jgi:uncharacterized protein (TIGR00290 family)